MVIVEPEFKTSSVVLIEIALNLQTALGSMAISIILILPIQEHGISFDFSVLSSIFFINVLQFSQYRSFTYLVKFIPRYFTLFDAILFFFTSLLEYNCFTMLCQLLLYNKVNQLYVYIYPHIPSLLHLPPTLPIPPIQVVKKHQADLPVQCSCFPLAICFIFGSVYMSMPLSHFVPASPSPSLCPQVHSLHLCVYSSPAPRLFRTIFFLFRFYIYVSAYGICFSLSDLLHSVMTDSRSIHFTTNNSIVSFYG